MKKLILLSLLCLSILSFGQDGFNGTVTMTIKVSGNNSSMVEAMLPTAYVYSFSEENMYMEFKGGVMAAMMGNILVTGADNKVYFMKAAEKTAYRMVESEEDSTATEDANPPKVEKLNETATIAGYKCDKYKITTTEGKETQIQYAWITKDLALNPPKSKTASGSGGLFIAGVDGTVLKLESPMDMEGEEHTMIMTVEKIDTNKPDPSLFVIPDDWTIKDMTPGAMLGLGK